MAHPRLAVASRGLYDAATDKEFAPWAPQEGDPRAAEYLQQLTARL